MKTFEEIHQGLMKASEGNTVESTQREQEELYILHCLYHGAEVKAIDFSKFSFNAIESAKDLFEDCIATSDEDGNIRFNRRSAWATIAHMSHIIWNLQRTEGKRVKPSFPLI